MEIAVYGHYGVVVLFFPAISDHFLENEELGLLEALMPAINKGKCKVYCVSGINQESLLNSEKSPDEKSLRLLQYNNYVIEELLPFIFSENGGPIPVLTCGVKHGAFYSANTYFRRPDLFYGTIALSGTFNIQDYTQDFFDDNSYFNSPVHFLPNLNDSYWLSFLTSKHHVYLLSGSGEGERPENSVYLSEILKMKGIPHFLEIWNSEWEHSPETWKAMLKFIFDNKL